MPDDRRYYGLDALRGVMMLLGIVLHSATFYVVSTPPHAPFPTDPDNSPVMDAVFDFIHSFRMPCFFVLAGFFASLLVEKRGLIGAYKNRLARIAAPLAASMLTILPVTLLFALDFAIGAAYGVHRLIPDSSDMQRLERDSRAQGLPSGFPLMHLWFLLYLLYFYLLIPFCRLLVRWSLPFEPRVARFLASPYSLLVFALYTAATLWPYPGGLVLGEFIMLGFSPPAVLYYGSFFVIGYLYHHYRASTASLASRVRWCGGLAAILFPLSLHASHLEFAAPGGALGYHVLAVTLHAICTWTLIWLFVGVALRWFDRPTAWVLYLSQSAYWVYLLHLPVVCVVAWLLLPVDVHALVKFSVVASVTTIVCFATYHYWVQGTWLGAFLNGKRFQAAWPWRAPRFADEAQRGTP